MVASMAIVQYHGFMIPAQILLFQSRFQLELRDSVEIIIGIDVQIINCSII